MARKGWEAMALASFEKANFFTGRNDVVMRVTVTLLAREHAKVVRLVKKLPRIDRLGVVNGQRVEIMAVNGQYIRLADLLAALATRKGGGG